MLWLAQPERDVRWLHGLLHSCEQVVAQLLQVYLIAQRGAKSR